MENYKEVTNKEYIYGDFDKDGVKNIDDPKPFNSQVKNYPTHKENPSYFHKARYGDGEREVLLSSELKALERSNNEKSPFLIAFLNENPGSKGRIKTVPSTMKKLRTRYYDNIKDTAGARILTDNRKQAEDKFEEIKKRYNHDKKETDDYYKKPKAGSYYAFHTGIIVPKTKSTMEVQITSKRMDALQAEMHKQYKRGGDLKRFSFKAKKLYKKGY